MSATSLLRASLRHADNLACAGAGLPPRKRVQGTTSERKSDLGGDDRRGVVRVRNRLPECQQSVGEGRHLVSGGYWEEPGPGRLIKVGYFANGLTRPRDVGNYLLYRCAEVAQREGATHFVLYNTLPDAISDVRSSERTVNANFGKPSTFAYILPAAENEPSALSAADLIARLGPLVKPAKEKAS